MPSTIEQLNPTRVKLTVEIPFADLKPHLDKAYKDIAGQVNIPGFRKGKVPAQVIDQRFGRGVVLQEAINDAMPGAYSAAVEEHKLFPLSQPDIEVTKLEDNELVEFTAELDVRPDFDLPDFEKIDVEVDAAQSSDEELDERIETLRKRFATTKEVGRKAKKGDLLTIDLKASQDGKELEDATAEDLEYEIGDDKNMLEGPRRPSPAPRPATSSPSPRRCWAAPTAVKRPRLRSPSRRCSSRICLRWTTSSPRWSPSSTPSKR